MQFSGRVESSTWYLNPKRLYTSSISWYTPLISSLIWSGRHEDVRIVLREAAHAHQAVQRAGHLVAVHQTQLAHAHGQIAVGARLRFW